MTILMMIICFLCFFACVLYRPFASDTDKLDIFHEGKHYIAYNLSYLHFTKMIYIELFIGGTLKSNVESRAKKRKRERNDKDIERANDTKSDRGFSTDQKITMDHNEILRAKLKHQQGENQGFFYCTGTRTNPWKAN